MRNALDRSYRVNTVKDAHGIGKKLKSQLYVYERYSYDWLQQTFAVIDKIIHGPLSILQSMPEFVFLKGIIKTNHGISSLYSHIQHTDVRRKPIT